MKGKLRSSQIVIAYSRNMEIRKRVFEFEEALGEKFKTPFRTAAIPDEFDPNIPRFESQSKHNHSQLKVSQNRISLATNFDGKLEEDKIKDYLLEKRKSISNLVDSENVNFIAYVLEIIYIIEEEAINPLLKKHTGAKAINDDCKDFTILYSGVFKEVFYLNIVCSKFTERELLVDSSSGNLKETKKTRQGISVKVDLNTKHYFEKNSKFDNHLYDLLEETVFEIIKEKELKDYLTGIL